MKKKFLNKAVSLTAAAALGCTNIIGTGIPFRAFADETEIPAETAVEEASSEVVSVLVKVSGDAVMALPEAAVQGTDFLDTAQAVQTHNEITNTQEYVQNQIRSFYPELNVKYSYSILCNGFSCEIPENLIDEVRNLPFVESVSKVQSTAVPKMAKALDFSQYPAFLDATGSSGEGQVIAVIDSGIDITHPMFSALDESIEVKLTEDDIAEIADTIGFNVDIDPSRAYISSKLPYVIDYVEDPYDGVADPEQGHGTHVAGIAAGNVFTDAGGNVISGVAKDAQLVFMAAGDAGKQGVIEFDAALAAMEDAVKLRADVINMSFGTGYWEAFADDEEMSLTFDAYTAVENAGIVICKAAGNSGDGTEEHGVNYAENPDISTMCDFPSGSSALIVASGENNVSTKKGVILHDGNLITYDAGFENDYLETFGDILETGDYEYVYCGLGYEQDFANLDLTGKIAVIDRGELLFVEKANNAAAAGAVGALIVNYEGNEDMLGIDPAGIPYVHISYEDGQSLKDAENKVISVTDEKLIIEPEGNPSVSSFSSWGVKQSLEIRPDITGIGGMVESAAYDNSTALLQGTSMASPYVAGCVAVVNEYLEKTGTELTGKEKINYIRNLLMNSAVLYEENGLYVQPRRQGAGLVNLNNFLNDKVILTGNTGEAKINLYDNIGDDFSFDVNITNLGDEDVTFSSAKLVLTTDGSYYDEELDRNIIAGQIALDSTADVSALLSVAAGESRTETISVSLNPEQTASIREAFVNGFFAEGFLVLEGAENNCNISVPILGFCGDWTQVPVFNDETIEPVVSLLSGGALTAGYSYAEITKLLSEMNVQVPDEEGEAIAGLAEENPEEYLNAVIELLFRYATEEQLAKLSSQTDAYYISPNDDGFADTIGVNSEGFRPYWLDGMNLYNADGELVASGETGSIPAHYAFTAEPMDDINGLPDGTYTASVTGHINYPGAENNPDVIEFPVIVDNTAPELTTEIREENGRQILTLKATDSALDGIYIFGTGNGGIAGVYDPETAEEPSADYLSVIGLTPALLMSENTFGERAYNAENRPTVTGLITGEMNPAVIADYNFSDLIVAEPDENGVFTIEYDITDLSAYSFSVMDKAYNVSVYESEANPAQEIASGLYRSRNGLFAFTDTTLRAADFQTGTVNEYAYTFDNGQAVLTSGEDSTAVTIQQINSQMLRLVYEDGTSEVLTYQFDGTLEDYPFYSVDELTRRSERVWLMMSSKRRPVTRTETALDENGMLTITLYGTDENGEEIYLIYFIVDITTGTGVDDWNDPADLRPFIPTFESDIRYSTCRLPEARHYCFDPENLTGYYISQVDKSRHDFTYTLTDTTFTLDFGDSKEEYNYIAINDLFLIFLLDDGEFSLSYSGVSLSLTQFYSDLELTEMALDYYEAKNGTRPENVTVTASPDYTLLTLISFEDGTVYTIGVQDGIGVDQNGDTVDLTESLAPLKDPFQKGIYLSSGNNFNYSDFTEVKLPEKYYYFDGNGGGTVKNAIDGTVNDFTYIMKPSCIEMYIVGEDGNEELYKLYYFENENGDIAIDWNNNGVKLENLVYQNDQDFDTFTFYTAEELEQMAVEFSPVEGVSAESSVNPDGTVSIVLTDETGEVTDSYTVDITTAAGKDASGEAVNLTKPVIPELPEDAYTLDELSDMALKDYEQKNGTAPANSETKINKDGTVSIVLTDKDGNTIDTYTVDPVSGEGTNSDGETVNLPQTGNNAPNTIVTASASAFLTLAGFFTVLKSGIFRRKRDND